MILEQVVDAAMWLGNLQTDEELDMSDHRSRWVDVPVANSGVNQSLVDISCKWIDEVIIIPSSVVHSLTCVMRQAVHRLGNMAWVANCWSAGEVCLSGVACSVSVILGVCCIWLSGKGAKRSVLVGVSSSWHKLLGAGDKLLEPCRTQMPKTGQA